MKRTPEQITLTQWESRYAELCAQGLKERFYGGPLSRHVRQGDRRLQTLRFDNSPAALALWNLLLTENDRLRQAKREGKKIIATMKDLGTIPVMALGFDNVAAFYPDGAWWTPCIEQDESLFETAAQHGIDESFCPVRAMLGAFLNQRHFPMPDRLICSTGAVCDDFSAIAQRLEQLGFAIHWWEMPRRRRPAAAEPSVCLPGGMKAPRSQVDFVKDELHNVQKVLEETAGRRLGSLELSESIKRANRFRMVLKQLRGLAYTSDPAPLGALEMLIAEMLALHYCSDFGEAVAVLEGLLDETRRRAAAGTGVLPPDAARVFWVNPVADLRAMNVLEECGGRVCGTDYLFTHTLDAISEDVYPLESLARTALADPMVGSAQDRAARICRDIVQFGAEGVVISRIPGASHCAAEGRLIGQIVQETLNLPVIEVEVPTVCDACESSLRTRLEALIETIKTRRHG